MHFQCTTGLVSGTFNLVAGTDGANLIGYRGFGGPQFGSLDPDVFRGELIVQFTETNGSSPILLFDTENLGQNFFQNLTLADGYSLDSADASYTSSPVGSQWTWAGVPGELVNGQSYRLFIR